MSIYRAYVADRYQIVGDDLPEPRAGQMFHIEARTYPSEKDVGTWAVTNGFEVLNKNGQWEWEPQPSSRTDDFKKRTRFSSPEEAFQAFVAAWEKENDAILNSNIHK